MSPFAGRKVLLGAAFWAFAAIGTTAAWRSLAPATRARVHRVQLEMWRGLVQPPPTFTILFRGGTIVERGNGVLALVDGKLERVGEVVRVRRDGPDPADVRATIAIDARVGEFRPLAGTIGVRRSQGRSFLFAVKTLLPAARWRQVQEHWAGFRARHAEELAREIEPLAGRLVSETLRAVAAELPSALERHRGELDRVVARMREELGRAHVQPLLVQELWPIVVEHAAGPAEAIGRELWERAPLMSFALRAAADRLLEDEPVRVEERWRRFVHEEALPTIRAHEGEMERAFAAIVRDVLASDSVQARAAAAWTEVREDREVQALARALVRELLVDNPHVAGALRQLADDPDVRERLARIGARFEEFLDPVGDLVFLDESGEGINPDLAYLIRLLLLRRDEQLIHLTGGSGGALEPGDEMPGRHEP